MWVKKQEKRTCQNCRRELRPNDWEAICFLSRKWACRWCMRVAISKAKGGVCYLFSRVDKDTSINLLNNIVDSTPEMIGIPKDLLIKKEEKKDELL